jgi:ubiquinone/menaquinone biosynthesis C-methylase UbiE
MPFEDNVFDAIFCVSTLEHVGMNNTIYGLGVEDDHVSQLDAMREMYRILKPKGKLLLTLPFGKFQNHGGFIQYDLAALGHVVINSDFKSKSICTFRLNRYWHFCKLNECSNVKYQEEKHRAGAVVCLILGK